jgi:hypothetical protein
MSRVSSPRTRVEVYLVHLRQIFAKKWDHFFWGGMPPVVAPESDLIFRGKPSWDPRVALGNSTTEAQAVQTAYNSSQ